ncbi:hypothetical protein KDA_36640 [Dictyobacter alpinus]|uniref:HAMP domain-containing protein n=2 Tax=Dictyobacter alpinus TaxID=2014873 RepID=A0A402BA56_9CHLR|nr:hypothetical protein KDA_36640 [Dictyobacter alpinus]
MRMNLFTRWWYRFASVVETQTDLSFKEKNAIRRSQTSSWILLVVIILVLIPIPSLISKPFALIPVLVAFVLDVVALILNKNKQTTLAGVIAIFTIEAGLIGTILSVPGGATAINIPLFALLFQSIIVAAYMLSPQWSFIVMVFNLVVTYIIFQSKFLSPALKTLYVNNPTILIGLFEVQIIVAVFSFIIVSSSNQAIANLDRSEEIIQLERREIARQEEELGLKQQLENGIQVIMQTHTRAANGDFTARAPLSQDNILWRVAYSLNNLLARLAKNANLEQERFKEQNAIHTLARHLHEGTLPTQRTGTAVDEIIVALSSKVPNQQFSPKPASPNQQTPPPPSAPLRDGRTRRTVQDAPPPSPPPWR